MIGKIKKGKSFGGCIRYVLSLIHIFTENGLPFGLDERVLKECIEQDGHMTDIVYTNTESFLAGKKGFHIFHV